MPRRKFTDAQVALVVRELENGARVEDVCRKLGVSNAIVYNWKKRYAGMMGTTEVRRLCFLEGENVKLKRLVADLSLDKVMLQDSLSKKD